jgi:hypothetical protein
MKIRKFNESIDDSREWITDFMSDLEIDFPGTEASLYPSKHPSIEPDIITVNILPKKEDREWGTIIKSTTNEDLGWSRKDLLKYIEDKIRFLVDGVDDLSFGYCSISTFSKSVRPTITHNLDLSSGKFTSRFKMGKLNLIQKIRIYLNHKE